MARSSLQLPLALAFTLTLLLLLLLADVCDAKQTYIVMLKSHGLRAAARRSSVLQTEQGKRDFVRDAALRHDLFLKNFNAKKLHDYTELADGFSARLTVDQANALRSDPRILFVAKDGKAKLLTTQSYKFLDLNNATSGLWKRSTGINTVVGIIDTGIWPESKSFSDTGFGSKPSKFKGPCSKGSDKTFKCNRKLLGARYVGSGYASQQGSDLASVVSKCGDYLSPRDSDGHGTHTSGTSTGSVVSQAQFSGQSFGSPHGVAYGARVAAYKVIWCSQYGTFSDIVSAMDYAVADGVDVLSMSIGSGPDQPGYSTINPIEYFALQATFSGVSVVMAGGNDGPSWFTVGNAAPWMLTVAASTIDRAFPMTAVLGNNLQIQGMSVANPGTPSASLKKFYSLKAGSMAASRNKTASTLCVSGSLSTQQVKGKVVLCKRGGVTITEKVREVQRAQGAGVLVYNDAANGNTLTQAHMDFPYMLISNTDGEKVKKYISEAKSPKAYLRKSSILVGKSKVEAPEMAYFSSVGPNGGSFNLLKPDIAAPGVAIIAASTQHKRRSPWALLSGTSMATPHVAGLVALLKSLHRDWPPDYIFSAIRTTASVMNNRRNPIQVLSRKATPFHFGSGNINPNAAQHPGLVYPVLDKYSAFMCSSDSGMDNFYSQAFVFDYCTDYPSTLAVDLNAPSITFYGVKVNKTKSTKRTLKNVGPVATYTAAVYSPAGTTIKVTPTKFKFSKSASMSYTISVRASKSSSKVKAATMVKSTLDTTVIATQAWTFGSIIWSDGKGHRVRIPISVNAV